jgi:PiT family inorganic phosphate transporter
MSPTASAASSSSRSSGDPVLIVFLIAVALLFDFLNGLHDAANSIATIVSTRVLRRNMRWPGRPSSISSPSWCSGCMSPTPSAPASSSPASSCDQVIFGALMGAIVWNLITWLAGHSLLESHALIGGLVGAGMAKAGLEAAVWSGLGKTAARHRAVAAGRLPAGAGAGR